MSFKPIQFNYTPPPTVVTPTTTTTSSSSTSTAVVSPVAAIAAIQSLNDLVDTSNYLQSLIVDKYSNKGVSIDPLVDPVTAQALANCYDGVVPPIITTGMYNNLLDCQFALQMIDSAAGIDSSIEADPNMLANVTQINNAVANSLLTDGGSDQLAIQSLALLKGDSIIFANIATALTVYQTGTDLSASVSDNLSTLINNESAILASLYSLQTTANVINADVNNVLNAYLYQPLADVVRITAAVKLLISLNYKKEAKKIFDGLATIAYSRLLSEVAPLYFAADQIAQRVLSPLKQMTGSMGSILNTVNSTVKSVEKATTLTKTTLSNLTQPAIKGFPNCNPCSQSVLKNISNSKLPNVPGFSGLSSGLQFLGQHISAAMNAINHEFSSLESTFISLQKRRNKDFADILQLMCALSAAESLISIGNQIITSPSITPNVNTITTGVLSSSNSNYTAPTAATNVMNVLTKGGSSITGVVSV